MPPHQTPGDQPLPSALKVAVLLTQVLLQHLLFDSDARQVCGEEPDYHEKHTQPVPKSEREANQRHQHACVAAASFSSSESQAACSSSTSTGAARRRHTQAATVAAKASAAAELARLGAKRIIVVGHNEARGAAAVEAIRGAGGSAEFLRADMGDATRCAPSPTRCSHG